MGELLFSITKNDFEITYFSGRGAGGQYRNKHQNCIRIKHIETGVITTGQSHRHMKQNKEEAFMNMAKHPLFRIWLNKKIYEKQYEKESIEDKVNKAIREENLKIDYGDTFEES